MAEEDSRTRPKIEEEMKKSDCGFVDTAKGAPPVLHVTNDSGFESAEDMSSIREKSETMIGEKSKFPEISESSFRQDRPTRVQEDLILMIKLYDKVYDYGTKGNESIHDMVVRMLDEIVHNRQPNVKRMLFKTLSDDCHLNLGLPTGALKRDVKYECIFGGRSSKNTTDFVRTYSVTHFHDDWHINSFDVKLESKVNVSYMQNLNNVTKLRVHFFPEETIYDALCRDGRFEKMTRQGDLVICSCDFVSVDAKQNGMLSVKAKKYAGMCIMLQKRNKKNPELPASVLPLEMPGHVAFKVLPNVKEEAVTPMKQSSEASHAVFQPLVHSTPYPSLQVRKMETFEDLKIYLEEGFDLKFKPERGVKKEDQRKRKFKTFLKDHCQNFALDFPHNFSFSDLENFIKLKFSVGAVIGVNVSEVEHSFGTCFRIGGNFVITNYHVYKKVIDYAGQPLSTSYVNFDYKGTEEGHSVPFIDNPLLFCSKELDYAIMELDTMCTLPASFTDQGYSIAPPNRHLQVGENLSLIGHPNGMPKMVNMSCPIKPKQEIDSHLNLAVHVLDKKEFEFHHRLVSEACSNSNTVVYDVSDFFWGSSGSPGILINEKLLMVLHFHGIILLGQHILEQGILMSSIVEDVMKKLDENDGYSYLTIDDIFGEGTKANFHLQPMEVD